MQLFEDNSFFAWVILFSLPAVFLGFKEKPIKYYGLAVTFVFIWLSMGQSVQALGYLTFFCVFELLLTKAYAALRRLKGRHAFIYRGFLLLSIAPLIFNKVGLATDESLHIMGFLGISYMTFKTAQIVIEIYDGLIDEISTFDFLYLILFFPTLLSGPIDRSRRFNGDIGKIMPKEEYADMVGAGLIKFFKGFIYKKILATSFFALIQWFGMGGSFGAALIYMYSYGIYLFFDFAGYSLMAIGVANVFGVNTPENFNAPFISKDIKDFWDRWHITLSHWFRDYLFSRITMWMIAGGKTKNKLVIATVAFMINMTIMGCWHGLTPYYIAYGAYHGLLLSLTEIFQKKSKFYKKHKKEKLFIAFETFITFNLVMFGFFIFSGQLHFLLFG